MMARCCSTRPLHTYTQSLLRCGALMLGNVAKRPHGPSCRATHSLQRICIYKCPHCSRIGQLGPWSPHLRYCILRNTFQASFQASCPERCRQHVMSFTAMQACAALQVWSNIGMAFFGKGRGMTALACLERARLQGPFEWIPSFNLGLVHLHMGHDVAAYTSFSAAINLNAGFAQSYMLLGIALGRLSDLDNACHAFQRAMDLDAGNALIVLNFGAHWRACPAHVADVATAKARCSANAWLCLLACVLHMPELPQCHHAAQFFVRAGVFLLTQRLPAAIALHHGGRQDEAAARLQEFHSMQTQEPGAEDALHGEMQDQAALLAAALSD